ncbi:MAG TPA: 2'-5' RNA ligase family protein, partial [Geodermatophilus sp.]|nr:2'-5' RNA ligase family protein [Geodermatophilus sp.]
MNDDTFVPRSRSAARTAVLGVVVPIPEPWSQLFVDWRAKVGDPQATSVPPHVTLLPPTEVPLTDRPAISAHLAEV